MNNKPEGKFLPKSITNKVKEKSKKKGLHAQFDSLQSYLVNHRNNERFWSYIEFSATLTLVVLFLSLAIRPTVLTIAKLAGEIKSKEEASLKMKGKIGDLLEAQSNYIQLQDSYDLFSSYLPEKVNYNQVVEQIVASGEESGVVVDKVSLDLDNEKNESQQMVGNYQVNFQSNWINLLSWADRLVQARRHMEISQISISQDKETEGAILKISLNGNFYWWKKKAILP